MDDLVKDLRYWSKRMDELETSGRYPLRPGEPFKLSVLLECAADTITNLRDQRDLALARARAAEHG